MKPLKASKPYEKSFSKKIIGQDKGLWLFILIFLLGSGLMYLVIKYSGINPGIEDRAANMQKKLEVISRMRLNLFKSVEAEKSAVIADTDEASQAFAALAQKAGQDLERDLRELDGLVKKDSFAQEQKLMQEFNGSWMEFRKIDLQLLDYAVRNTNIKAAKLSFAQGGEEMKRFEEALNELGSGKFSNGEEAKVSKLITEALVGAVKIHYLHAPHIAAANDGEMDNIEAEIKKHQEKIKRSLEQLKTLIPVRKQAAWQKAKTADEELMKVTAKVIELSRQNTTIKSFEISLGRKRKITAQCDQILLNLHETIQGRSFRDTR